MPPEGAEHPANSSGNTGVHFKSGAQSGALSGKTAADHPNESEGTDQDGAARGSSTAGAPSGSGDPLTKLAAALLTLSPADRERLAAMLASNQPTLPMTTSKPDAL